MKRRPLLVLLVACSWISASVRAEEKAVPAAPVEVKEFKADDLEGLRAFYQTAKLDRLAARLQGG